MSAQAERNDATALAEHESEERYRVRLWRREQFREMGFNARQAGALSRGDADLHEAARLQEMGCPAEIAFDILSD